MNADGVNGLPLKATGTVLDHRLCSQQSVYDARASSRIKVRIHYIRDWVVDYSQPVTVWLITDWAWYRYVLLMPNLLFCCLDWTALVSLHQETRYKDILISRTRQLGTRHCMLTATAPLSKGLFNIGATTHRNTTPAQA